MVIDERTLHAQDLLRRLAQLPDQAGVLARPSEAERFLHVYDPLASEWVLLAADDLPGAVRRLAGGGEDLQESEVATMVGAGEEKALEAAR